MENLNEKKQFDLITLGEILLRFSPDQNNRLAKASTLNIQAGGAELNVASGVSILGLNTAIITKLPKNDLSTLIIDNVRALGVSDSLIVFDSSKDARVGTYYYEYGAYPRKPNVIYDRKSSSFSKICNNDFKHILKGNNFSSTKMFHLSGITLALSKSARESAYELVKFFKKSGALISFDVNYRANLWDEDEARKCIEQILPYVDILFCSQFTANHTFKYYGDLKTIMQQFCDKYNINIMASTKRIVHSPKSHSFSSTIYNSKEQRYYEEPPYENIDVIDRIGSGDAYVSGVLYGLLQYNLNCKKALEFGNAASALKNTVTGDILCTNIDEIISIINDHSKSSDFTEMNR